MERCRLAACSGKILADGWSEPALQKSGLAGGRMRAAAQTRPFSSIIWLWMLAWLSQIGSAPQNDDGAIGSSLWFGVFASRTGCLMVDAVCVFGSSTGKKSVLFSGAP